MINQVFFRPRIPAIDAVLRIQFGQEGKPFLAV